MARTTPNFSFTVPTSGETGWAAGVNANWDALDLAFSPNWALQPVRGGFGGSVQSPSVGAVPVGNAASFTVATTNTIQVQGITVNVMSCGVGTFNQVVATALSASVLTATAITAGVATINQIQSAAISGNVATINQIRVGGSGTLLTQITIYTQVFTPANVAASTVSEQSFTVNGVATSDVLQFNPPTNNTAATPVAIRPNGSDHVTVVYVNASGSIATPNSGTYTIMASRR